MSQEKSPTHDLVEESPENLLTDDLVEEFHTKTVPGLFEHRELISTDFLRRLIAHSATHFLAEYESKKLSDEWGSPPTQFERQWQLQLHYICGNTSTRVPLCLYSDSPEEDRYLFSLDPKFPRCDNSLPLYEKSADAALPVYWYIDLFQAYFDYEIEHVGMLFSAQSLEDAIAVLFPKMQDDAQQKILLLAVHDVIEKFREYGIAFERYRSYPTETRTQYFPPEKLFRFLHERMVVTLPYSLLRDQSDSLQRRIVIADTERRQNEEDLRSQFEIRLKTLKAQHEQEIKKLKQQHAKEPTASWAEKVANKEREKQDRRATVIETISDPELRERMLERIETQFRQEFLDLAGEPFGTD